MSDEANETPTGAGHVASLAQGELQVFQGDTVADVIDAVLTADQTTTKDARSLVPGAYRYALDLRLDFKRYADVRSSDAERPVRSLKKENSRLQKAIESWKLEEKFWREHEKDLVDTLHRVQDRLNGLANSMLRSDWGQDDFGTFLDLVRETEGWCKDAIRPPPEKT